MANCSYLINNEHLIFIYLLSKHIFNVFICYIRIRCHVICSASENRTKGWEYLRMNEFIDMWSEFILIWYDFIPIWNEFIHECDSFLGNEEA